MLISVIVPVYNVQDYITDCVSSILSQDFQDFELLLVDDGSTDRSGKMCDELLDEDPRIRVYHKVNGGLADARNYGIEKAKGDYLTFIDSDDFLLSNYLSSLKDLIQEYGAETACVQMFVSGKRNQRPDNEIITTGSVSGHEAISDCLLRKNFGVSACAKLFKASLFEELRYPKGKLFEDILTIPYVFEKCECVAYTTAQLYFYYNRPGSITHTKVTGKHLAFLDDTAELIRYMDHHCPEAHDAGVTRFCIESIKRLTDILLLTDDYRTYIETIRHKSWPYWEEGLRTPLLAKSIKVQIMILSKSASLYELLFKPYKKLKYKLTNNIVN